jgi:hypothetical protein
MGGIKGKVRPLRDVGMDKSVGIFVRLEVCF